MKAPESEAEALRASPKHRTGRVPKQLQTAVDVVEVECVDHLRHRREDGDAIDVIF